MTHRAFTVYKPDGVTITLPTETSLEAWQGRGLIDESDLVVDLHGRWVRGGDVATRPAATSEPALRAQQTHTNLSLPVQPQRQRPVPVWLAAVATLIIAFAAAAAIAQLRADTAPALSAALSASETEASASRQPTGVVTLAMVDGKRTRVATAAAPKTPPVRATPSVAAAAVSTRPGAAGPTPAEAFVGPAAAARTATTLAAASHSGPKRMVSGGRTETAAPANTHEARKQARLARRAERKAAAHAKVAARKAAQAERRRLRKAQRKAARTGTRVVRTADVKSERAGASKKRVRREKRGEATGLNSFSGLMAEAKRVKRRDPELAVNLYTRALLRNPANAGAMAGLARSLQWSGKAHEALRTYRGCVEELPRYGPCLAGLGKLLERYGDHAGARKAYLSYLDATPNGSQAKAIRQRLEGLRR